jgi:curved DNA-binding protein CbpA
VTTDGGDGDLEREHLAAWLERLDVLTYYELFGIAEDASDEEVRDAFHAFCDVFHPDRHRDSPPDRVAAVGTIFRRGTEAYGVLTDPALRGHYDAELAVVREVYRPPPRPSQSPHSRPPPAPSLEDRVRVPSARPFAQRAEQLMRDGDYRQAKLQLVLAKHIDPENPDLEQALRDLEEYLARRRGSSG